MGRSAGAGVALVVLAACGSKTTEPPPVTPAWQAVFQDLPGGLLRVWGRSSRDVYAVGAADDQGSVALHYDGRAWKRLATGTREDLWWVDAVGDDDVRMVGAKGLILVHHPRAGTFERR